MVKVLFDLDEETHTQLKIKSATLKRRLVEDIMPEAVKEWIKRH